MNETSKTDFEPTRLLQAIFNKQFTNEGIYDLIVGFRNLFDSLEKLKDNLVRPIVITYFPNEPIKDHSFYYTLLINTFEIETICENLLSNNIDVANSGMEILFSFLFLPFFDTNCNHFDEEHQRLIGSNIKCKICNKLNILLKASLADVNYVKHCHESLLDHYKQIREMAAIFAKASTELEIFKNNMYGVLFSLLMYLNKSK